MYFSPVLIGFGLASYGSTESHSRFNSGNLDERFLERVHHQSPSAHCFKYKKKITHNKTIHISQQREPSLSPTSPVPDEDLSTAPASRVSC